MPPPGTHLCTRSNNWVAERLCTSWGSQLLNTFLWYPDTMTYIRIGSCVRTCSSIRIYVWAYATVCVVRCVRTHFTNRGMCQKVDNAVVSLVGARFARPKTVCFVSSGRQILPYSCRWDRSFSFDIPSWRWVSIQCCCALFPPACLGFVRRCLPIVLPVGGISLSAVLFE